ncbi:MAG: hypothetical protein ACREWG_04935 [Gammaproteobacteria bacterium]
MAEEGVPDHRSACQKAVLRLGLNGARDLPDHTEIAAELGSYQRIFRSATQGRRLRELREAARSAMTLTRDYHPRLAGPILDGTATAATPVVLHLHCETPEEVAWLLIEHGIPYELCERHLRYSARLSRFYPCYRFMAGEAAVEMVVLRPSERQQAPLSALDGRPMARASLVQLERLLAADAEAATRSCGC